MRARVLCPQLVVCNARFLAATETFILSGADVSGYDGNLDAGLEVESVRDTQSHVLCNAATSPSRCLALPSMLWQHFVVTPLPCSKHFPPVIIPTQTPIATNPRAPTPTHQDCSMYGYVQIPSSTVMPFTSSGEINCPTWTENLQTAVDYGILTPVLYQIGSQSAFLSGANFYLFGEPCDEDVLQGGKAGGAQYRLHCLTP